MVTIETFFLKVESVTSSLVREGSNLQMHLNFRDKRLQPDSWNVRALGKFEEGFVKDQGSGLGKKRSP